MIDRESKHRLERLVKLCKAQQIKAGPKGREDIL